MNIGNTFTIKDINDFVSTMWAGKRVNIVPFQYPVSFGAVVVGAESTETLTIAGDSDFVLLSLSTAFFNASSAVLAAGTSTIEIVDSATNEKYTDSPAIITSYCNDLENLPQNLAFNALPMPRRIAQRSTLSLTLTNVSAANFAEAFVVLEGLRVWEYTQ